MDHLKDTELSTVEVDNGPQGEAPQIEVLDKTEQPVAPDQFDENYRTTRNEIWAYYACVRTLSEMRLKLNTRTR
jgi:hypothetical protein